MPQGMEMSATYVVAARTRPLGDRALGYAQPLEGRAAELCKGPPSHAPDCRSLDRRGTRTLIRVHAQQSSRGRLRSSNHGRVVRKGSIDK
jgi:hypothetical protein